MDEETRERYRRLRKYAMATALIYLIIIPINLVLIFWNLFSDRDLQHVSDFVSGLLNLVTLLFMIYTNEHIKATGGWVGKELKMIRPLFWILILVNMSFLANYIVNLF